MHDSVSEMIITIAELQQRMADNHDFLLIDVRTHQEKAMHDIGGELISQQDLVKKLQKVAKEKEIILYCHSGVRSLLAAKTLRDAGFNAAKSLEGGIVACLEQGIFRVK